MFPFSCENFVFVRDEQVFYYWYNVVFNERVTEFVGFALMSNGFVKLYK